MIFKKTFFFFIKNIFFNLFLLKKFKIINKKIRIVKKNPFTGVNCRDTLNKNKANKINYDAIDLENKGIADLGILSNYIFVN